MKPVKIAQVGSAHDHAPAAFRALCKNKDCFEVVGAAERDPNVKDSFLNTVPMYTIEELLAMPDLEAVAVECEEEYATAVALRFAERGIAVHMDKPGSANTEMFDRLVNTLEKQQLAFNMGYMYRYNPLLKKIFAMVENGELGEIFSVEAHMSVRHDTEKRHWLGKHCGGMMYFLGCHLVDLVYRLQGEPQEILPMNCSTGVEGVTAEDYGFAVLRYPNGTSFIKTCATEYNGFDRRQLVICGSKGTVEVRPLEEHIGNGKQRTVAKITLAEKAPPAWANGGEVVESEPYDRYDEMMCSFARRIRGEQATEFSYDYERALFRLVMKCSGR